MDSSDSHAQSESTNDFIENFDMDLIDLKQLVQEQLNKEQEVEEDTDPEQPPRSEDLLEMIKKLEYSIQKSRQERQYVLSCLDQLNSSILEISSQSMQEFMEKQLILGNKDKLITSLCTRNEELLFSLINLKKENRRLNQELLYQISINEIKDMGQLVFQLQNQLSNMSKKIMDDQVLKKIEDLETKLDEKQLEIHNLEKINLQNNKMDKKIYPQISKKIKKLRKKSQSEEETNPKLSKTRQKKRINYKEYKPEPAQIISDPEEIIVEVQNRQESSAVNSQSQNSQNNDELSKPNKKLALKKQIRVNKIQYKNNRNMCLDAIEDFLQF